MINDKAEGFVGGGDMNFALEGLVDTGSIPKSTTEHQEPAIQQQTPPEGAEPKKQELNNEEGGQQPEPAKQEPKASDPAQAEGSDPVDDDGVEIESPLFGGKKKIGGQKKDEGSSLNIENKDQINSYVKEKFGVEDFDTLANKSIPKWRDAAQKLPEVEKQLGEVQKFFETMDPELFEVVKTYGAGGDWKKALEVPRIDFKKEAGQIANFDLVNYYFPGKYKPEDFEGDELDTGAQIALESSQKFFNRDKVEWKTKTDAHVARAAEQKQRFQASIGPAVETLQKSFPDIDEKTLTEVKGILEGGDAIRSLFFNQDGSLRPDAAVRVSMALHGQPLVEQAIRTVESRAKSAVREEYVQRKADHARAQGGGSTPHVNEKVKKMINEVNELKDNQHY